MLAGCALYLVGAIVVTMAANVPLNDALMNVDPEAADAAARWSSYLADWTRVEPRARRDGHRRLGPADRGAARQPLTA